MSSPIGWNRELGVVYAGLGLVDPPSHLGEPLFRTGLAELPHPAPDRSFLPRISVILFEH